MSSDGMLLMLDSFVRDHWTRPEETQGNTRTIDNSMPTSSPIPPAFI